MPGCFPARVTDEDLELLRFAKLHWQHRGAQATAIRDRFGLSETLFWQRVLHLAGTPQGWQAEPALCKRLTSRRRVLPRGA